MDGTVYREGKGSESFDALLRSIRKGDIVRVYRPFLLAPSRGSAARKRKAWADRAEAIKARGACLQSIDPPLSGAKLAMAAYEQIAKIARGAGKGKSGRPRKEFPDDVMRVIERLWPPRKGMTVDAAVAEINRLIAPRTVKRGWLYANVK